MAGSTQGDETGIKLIMEAFHGQRHKNRRWRLVGFVCDRQNRKMLFSNLSSTDLTNGHIRYIAGRER